MEGKTLGKAYQAGEAIVRQGEVGDCMYVIQAGEVEIIQQQGPQEVRLAVMGPGDFFGEMAMFEKEVRSATVRAVSEARVLTVDKRTFMGRVHEDPSLAYRIVQTLCKRLRRLNAKYAEATAWWERTAVARTPDPSPAAPGEASADRPPS